MVDLEIAHDRQTLTPTISYINMRCNDYKSFLYQLLNYQHYKMQFNFTISDEVDLGILHETLLHLMCEHPPIVLKITVEFDSASFLQDSSSSQPPNWSPDATSSPVHSTEQPFATEDELKEDQPMDRPKPAEDRLNVEEESTPYD